MSQQNAFRPIPSPFGAEYGSDEQATQDAFVDYIGGFARAERIDGLFREISRMGGSDVQHRKVFREKANAEGFTEAEIDAFFML